MIERSFVERLVKDDGGSHTTEMALAMALFALIAGFGFFFFGQALAQFFVAMGENFNANTLAIPSFNN